MKSVTIEPGALRGTVTPPPSKSAAHRAVICAALAGGESRLTPAARSQDIEATSAAVRALGARVEPDENGITVRGIGEPAVHEALIDCRESGSTLRFLIPVAAAMGGGFTFTGSGRLPQRPIGPYLDCLPGAGVACETAGGLPLTVSGQLEPGIFTLPGDVSSQFVTGLLLALPLLKGDSEIRLSSPLQSAAYVDMTLQTMRRFGVEAERTPAGFRVPGGQSYRPQNLTVESDWSQAAFWLAAGAIGGSVVCKGIPLVTSQGDAAVASLLTRFGAYVRNDGTLVASAAAPLAGFEIDAGEIPDLVPILAATACFARGDTFIRNAARLRLKESDRLATIAAGLRAFGGQVEELPDGLRITGGPMRGGKADGAGDHRIVMALAIAATRCEGPSEITGSECISKSYPTFFDDFIQLGGRSHVVHLG